MKAQTNIKIDSVTKTIGFDQDDYLPGRTNKCAAASVLVTNIGDKLAFHTGVEITNADCRYTCSDNYFLLMPGESKQIDFFIDRSLNPFYDYVRSELIDPVGDELEFTASAWNAPSVSVKIKTKN